MKIKLLEDFRGKKAGDEIDFPERHAKMLLAKGVAEKVGTSAKKKKVSPVSKAFETGEVKKTGKTQ